ncbi:MAG: nitrate reductase [Proteobacteria bacterium]|nr:nitrate reductase [Pseudomonadota bacterium]
MNNFNTLYNLVTGPLVWLTFLVFIGGSVYKIRQLFSLVNNKEKFIYSYMSLKFSLRSLAHWVVPFATVNWRKHPVMTVMTFLFHFCLVLMPLFLTAHVTIIHEAWGIRWVTLPDGIADTMTMIVIAGALFFLIRRFTLREVRYLSVASDYVLVAIVAAPFVTGFLAYHHILNYQLMLILHILSGEIMLMAIPFTRFSHMLYAIFTRTYIGSEFGSVRHARDW